MAKKVPLGVDNFHKPVTGGYLFCDKTSMLAEFLGKGDEVTLIARPCRWGKTLNMSMLQHFFSPEVSGIPTSGLFDDLAIGRIEGGKWIQEKQGKHPVIIVSFKDIHADDFQGAYDSIYLLFKKLYGSFEYLFESRKLNSDQINKAYGDQDDLDDLVAFMRNLLSSSLKGNNALERGVLTGILRVSKDSMLSGLNNLKTYTLLDQGYSSHFGFIESEVKGLLTQEGLSIHFKQVQSWYNGYRVGELVMYNPWFILSCLSEKGHFDVYWVNTGNNDLIKRSLFRSNPGIKSKFKQLMQGESIVVPIDKHLSFDVLDRNETTFWSLLLFAGYLKVEKCHLRPIGIVYDCWVSIPNQEVFRLYTNFFEEWFSEQFDTESHYTSFLDHLASGDVVAFIQELSNYLFNTASMFDTQGPRKSEGFYHGFVLAMLASLGHTHYIKSNRESGKGRYDVLIIPKEVKKAIVLEFKHVRKTEELEEKAKGALAQIQSQSYRTELAQYVYVEEVVEVGIAFYRKYVIESGLYLLKTMLFGYHL